MSQENFGTKYGSPEVTKTMNEQLSKGRIAVRLNDTAKTIIFVKPGKNIDEVKEVFNNRPDSYNTFSTKAVEARERAKEQEKQEQEKQKSVCVEAGCNELGYMGGFCHTHFFGTK